MKLMTEADARDYLVRHGVTSTKKIDEILGGFDFRKPVYEQPLEPGDTLFQSPTPRRSKERRRGKR